MTPSISAVTAQAEAAEPTAAAAPFGANDAATAVNPIAAQSYREAMARLASAVHLVTTDGVAGRGGFTASAVCSVSDSPPTLLVCVNRSASAFPYFEGNDVLCVNALAEHQANVAGAFGGRTPMDERFAGARWTRLVTGSPVLEDALVAFDCRVTDRLTMATHDILFCEVVGLGGESAGTSLVYAHRRFHVLRAVERDEGTANP